MAKIVNPPLYADLLDGMKKGSQLSQGWLQFFSQLIGVVSGTWNKYSTYATFSVAQPTIQRTSQTPYSTLFYARFESSAGAQSIEFKDSLCGVLLIADGTTLKHILVNGKTAQLPAISAGSVLSANLMEVK